MDTIRGVVGSIEVEKDENAVRIEISYHDGKKGEIQTNSERINSLWMPALNSKDYKVHCLDSEGEGVEILKQDGLLYVQSVCPKDCPQKGQAVFNRTQLALIKKVLGIS
jgi:hypothetical protein